MIKIVDFSGIIHSVVHGREHLFEKEDIIYDANGKESIEPNRLKQGLIGSLIYYKNYKGLCNEYIICSDAPPYWRNEHIAYKCTRGNKEDNINWTDIFKTVNEFLEEVDTLFPWKFIKVKHCEGDDCIAIITKLLGIKKQKIMIISSDNDLVQLQVDKNVTQYSPITKKFVKPEISPYIDLEFKLLKGDAKDSIPNIKSPNDFFARKMKGEDVGKQKSITKKLCESAKLSDFNPEVFCENKEEIANHKRNRLLIDFDKIPEKFQLEIVNKYNGINHNYNYIELAKYIHSHKMHGLKNKLADI